MRILKFGGSSVANVPAIKQVIGIVQDTYKKDKQLLIVVSAQSGVTDSLVTLCNTILVSEVESMVLIQQLELQHLNTLKELMPMKDQATALAEVIYLCNQLRDLAKGARLVNEVTQRTQALLLSFGERLSAFVISQAIHYQVGATDFVDARELIKTDSNFRHANINFSLTNKNIQNKFASCNCMYVITGFIASSIEGNSTTLGRGGSDYTASIIGAALQADAIEIWTDVDGVMTADPRFVREAQSIKQLTYNEAMELSHFGAKVIFSSTMQPAMSAQIPILVKNTFNPTHEGTLIDSASHADSSLIKGISSLKEVALLNVEGSGMAGVAGFSARLFNTLSLHNISVILISQASSEHSICVAIAQQDATLAIKVLHETFEIELEKGLINPIQFEQDLAIVAVVGENMRLLPGLAARVFTPLGRNGINLKAIAQGSSELNISIVIKQSEMKKAVRVLHQSLFNHDQIKLHIYMAGMGAIGKRLLEMIAEQDSYFASQNIHIECCGIINSKTMLIDNKSIIANDGKQTLLEQLHTADFGKFVQKILNQNLENSVFVDVTAADEPTHYYASLLDHNVAVVAANKRANTQDIQHYKLLQSSARKRNTPFHYETNVGAGLPVINVLRSLSAGGDKVLKIEAVLSGTMNYLLSEYDASQTFSDLVKIAKEHGYTEPDPRDDLSGMDVARKCLILARECGWDLELEDIEVESLMNSEAALAKDIPSFFKALEAYNAPFEARYQLAKKQGKRIRYVALLEHGKANVSAMEVDESHPFYTLKGTENCISLTTNYYQKYPMVIKGPGAGVDVTAAGVLADIVRIAERISKL